MEEWNEIKFKENMLRVLGEIIEETKGHPTYRGESLLLTNHVEWALKNIMEFLLEAKSARLIARGTIAKILKEQGRITPEFYDEINYFTEIRDLYSHNLSYAEVTARTETLIEKMVTTKRLKNSVKDWEKLELYQKLARIFLEMLEQLTKVYNDLNAEKSKKTKLS